MCLVVHECAGENSAGHSRVGLRAGLSRDLLGHELGGASHVVAAGADKQEGAWDNGGYERRERQVS